MSLYQPYYFVLLSLVFLPQDAFSLWLPERSGGVPGGSLPSLSLSRLFAGWCRLSTEVDPLTWGVCGRSAAAPTPPRPQPGLAGTHTGTRPLPVSRVTLFMLVFCGDAYCAAVSTQPPSLLVLGHTLTQTPGNSGWNYPRENGWRRSSCRWCCASLLSRKV